jgi:BMFP domain-containing protein YqiC
MAKSPILELFATLKSYAQKLSDGERSPAEIAAALNDWAHESAESVRGKIHEEVEAAVLKMGFVKREEFEVLVKEVEALKKVKKAAARKPVTKKIAKKSTPKKKAVKR